MPTLNYSVAVNGLGGNINKAIPRTADGGGIREITVPAGKPGQLTTRTDDETGTLTMESGHGISTSDVIDLYWEGGARFGITVGTVSSNSVPIGADNAGSGDNLPTNLTNIVACVPTAFNADIDGDSLKLIAVQPSYTSPTEDAQSHVSFLDADDDEIEAITMEANIPRVFDIEGGDANGFSGDPITHGTVSNGSSTNEMTLKILWLQDATP